jgi:hypothetical protein
LILKYKRIRFNSLDKVDDVNEGNTPDLGNIGNAFLVSCWTDSPFENIALWKMYSNNFYGCRITMPSSLFKQFNLGVVSKDDPDYKEDEIIITENEQAKLVVPYVNLIEVKYKRDSDLCKEDFLFYDNSKRKYILKHLTVGTTKSEYWSFQKEWRFFLYVYPKDNNEGATIQDFIENYKNIRFDYFDLEIHDEEFKMMEIVLGPFCNESSKIIVESLIKEYNPGIKLLESELKGRLRK